MTMRWGRVLGTFLLGALAVTVGCTSGVLSDGSPRDRASVPEPPSSTLVPPSADPGPPVARGPQPVFGQTVTLADAPPPISGGTLVVTGDGLAVAADPDRDQVYVVGLADGSVKKVVLTKHDEPGRLVLDDAGRAHVVLRSGGAIATIDVATGTLLSRRDVCPAPRGIAFDSARARLLVACADGEVLALPPAPEGAKAPFATLPRDLRDVVVLGDRIYVSEFRSAKIHALDPQGADASSFDLVHADTADLSLAWRMIAPPAPSSASAPPVVLHQLASRDPLSTQPGGYGGAGGVPGDGGVPDSGVGGGPGDDDACELHSTTTSSLQVSNELIYLLPTNVVLPVDVALVKGGYAIVAAGNGHTPGLAQVYVVPDLGGSAGSCHVSSKYGIAGQATAIAAYQDGFVVQSREPAKLVIPSSGVEIRLDASSREDTGHAIFHSNSGAGLACASCHGEGGDDGHVWAFADLGARRTPSMHGTLAGTAPYHWNGEEADIGELSDDVMTGRMSGPSLANDQKGALQHWLFALPAPAKSGLLDATAVARGKTIFEDKNVGCATCHSGASFTNSATVDVGTGGAFQVPSLVGVSARAPFLHDGCAATLRDRFVSCGGGDLHGHTSPLTEVQIGDLISYLESL